MLKFLKRMLGNERGQVTLKPPKNIPFQTPNPTQLQTLTPQAKIQAVPTQAPAPAQDLSGQVLQTAQQQALTGLQTPIQGLVQQKTQQLLEAPQVPDQRVKQLALEQFDVQRAQAQEAARQGLADVAGAGQIQDLFLREALGAGERRAQFGTRLDIEAQQRAQEANLRALSEGRATLEQQQQLQTGGIQNLLASRQGSEAEAQREFAAGESAIERGLKVFTQSQDIAAQQNLATLQGKIQQGLQLTAQDFQGVQADLDRNLKTSLQANDINATRDNLQTQLQIQQEMQQAGFGFEAAQLTRQQDFAEIEAGLDRQQQLALQTKDFAQANSIEQLRQEFTAQQATADREFERVERIATQGWRTDERLGEQDFRNAFQLNEQKAQEALQANDFLQQGRMFEQRANLELKMQTNDMDFQEKQLFLQDELSTARADGDVGRQKQLISFQSAQDFERIKQAQGFQAAQSDLDRKLQEAMQAGDFEHAITMQKNQFDFAAEEALADRELEQARVELQARGVDLAEFESQFNQILETAGADAAGSFLKENLAAQGITLDIPDASEAMRKALDAEYDSAIYQWGKTNPGKINPLTGGFVSKEAQQEYNDFFNKNVMGEGAVTLTNLLDGIVGDSQLRGAREPDHENFGAYTELLNSSPTFAVSSERITTGNDRRVFVGSIPAKGEFITTTVDDARVLLKITSSAALRDPGPFRDDIEYFTAMDVNTGNVVTISADQ